VELARDVHRADRVCAGRSGWSRPGLGHLQMMTQRLRTDDRIAFPFGCSADN
jgi:hypothetical protein